MKMQKLMLLLMTVGIGAASVRADDGPVRFNRDIRPILSNRCFACHGPDEEQREADMRLDQRSSAVAERDGHTVIAPGHPEASELIARVSETDPDLRMPPGDDAAPLTPQEIDTLRQWISEGAEYEGHWAFLPVADENPPLPEQSDQDPSLLRNGIDAFIQHRLRKQNVTPSPEADRRTLIRRVTLDLTGLLPTPGEVTEFVQDPRDDAFEQLVDRLLTSPHYGERWGRHWLDQARYADSNGYTIDGARVMWPYRDWVIQALNSDMPFDQFTIEQLAGDLLPDASQSQLIATGFHRNTLINQEGGTDPEQFRVEAVVDRTSTTGAVWLGLTVGCAQCHSHKFDPISHREFYQLFAFFNHTADVNNVGPTVEVHEGELFLENSDPQLLKALEEATHIVDELKKKSPDRRRQWETKVLSSLDNGLTPDQLDWHTPEPESVTGDKAAFSILNDNSILATQGAPREIYRIETANLPHDSSLGSIQLEVLPHESLPRTGPGLASNGNFVLTAVELFLGDERLKAVSVSSSHSQKGYPASAFLDEDPGTGWAINVSGSTSKKMNSPHTAWIALDRPVATGGRPLRIVMKHELNNDYNTGRFRFSWSSEIVDASTDPELVAALSLPESKRASEQKKTISEAFAVADVPMREAVAAVDDLRRQIGLGPVARTMVMKELATPRPTWILTRGDFLRPDKSAGPVEPGVMDCLPPLPTKDAADSLNRLDLARWLVSETNPLTARVFVNRVWMRYFGRGLVETENDFGSQGSPPTHPALLDWLARQFMEQGWSQKSLHRLIVTSHTYRQSSLIRPDVDTVDPLNLLLARQSRLRMDAEIIRDAALSASGALNPVIGGPGVHPPQPDGVYSFTQNRKSWQTDTGPDRFRRGMYTMFYRSAPYPALTTFDSPDFQSVCTRRARSNTPLQALTMANDAAMFELAQLLGRRVMAEASSDSQRIRRLFEICFSRFPTPQESDVLAIFLKKRRDHEAAQSQPIEEAQQKNDESEPRVWTAAARALMNTDEFITRE